MARADLIDHNSPPLLSIVIPVLNEDGGIGETLDALVRSLEAAEIEHELIVVDGGSGDATKEVVRSHISQANIIESGQSRAMQMNAGANMARAPWLFFLHGDTHVAPDLMAGLKPYLDGDKNRVFAFDLVFRSEADAYRKMEKGIAWRCENFALAYGDQGLCISRSLFDRMNGFCETIPMEDLDLALRLRAVAQIETLPFKVYTSTRQWDEQGIVMGVALNLGKMAVGIVRHYLCDVEPPSDPVESNQVK